MTADDEIMAIALEEARLAAAAGEVPAGCVIVDIPSGEILARAHNRTETLHRPTAHAEILAIEEAARRRGNWRIVDSALYVTKEPCPMCAGAIILARCSRVVWGVADPKRGGASVFDMFAHPGVNHHPAVQGGVMEKQCLEVLQTFFKTRRKSK
ncbi:MAG: nucleoside deaminase [Kiritimatiellae bacterium]|nr:nucleoside deaminase [Kiritimatiellia bacterium]